MIVVTVTSWRRKLFFALVGIFFLLGLSYLYSESVTTGRLEDDVLNQPVKVQGEAGIRP